MLTERTSTQTAHVGRRYGSVRVVRHSCQVSRRSRSLLVVVTLAMPLGARYGTAATSGTVVGATVPSATNIDTGACASGVAGRTHFGSVLPGTSVVTPTDCSIVFGSSNDTARLRIEQTDQLGIAMYQPSRGTLDPTFDTDGRVTTATAPGNAYDAAEAVAIQPDGKIITAGVCEMGGATGWDACLASYDNAGTMQQYAGGSADWATVGTSHLAACLRATTTATATWTLSATCPASNGAHWNPIPTTATQLATSATNITTAAAHLRFGLRNSTQPTAWRLHRPHHVHHHRPLTEPEHWRRQPSVAGV